MRVRIYLIIITFLSVKTLFFNYLLLSSVSKHKIENPVCYHSMYGSKRVYYLSSEAIFFNDN